MKPYQALRIVSILLAGSGFCLWVLQVYFGMMAPVLPYQVEDNNPEVRNVSNRQYAGSLQPGDKILTLNGQYLRPCHYLIDSPSYGLPRNIPFPVTYQKNHTNAQLSTNIVVVNPSIVEMFGRSPGYLMALVFLVTGIIILVGGIFDLSHLLLGAAWLSFGLMYAGWENAYGTPLSIIAWWGIPVSTVLLVVAHAVWPVNQLGRPAARIAIIAVGLISLAYLSSFFLPGSTWFGCNPLQTIPAATQDMNYSIYTWTYQGLNLTYFVLLYLIICAYRQTDHPFSRLQIRAIAWAIGLGLAAPVLFSLFITDRWGPLGDLTFFIPGIIPVTYLFVLYRGELLSIDRYLNRLIFTCVFLIFWVVVMLAAAGVMLSWQPDIDPTLLALSIALPCLLAATFVRERLGLLVDLVLHGTYYEYETVVSEIGQGLAVVENEADLARVIVRQLPQALSIRHAALWLMDPENQFRLVDHSAVEPVHPPLLLPVTAFPDGSANMEIKNLPFQVGPDPTPWQVILRLYAADTRLVGIILLGIKYRENTYNERDICTLQTLAGWIATTASNLTHQVAQQRQAAREHRLMLALAENEERLMMGVAHELHDRGISALGIVRLMVEQDRARAIVCAGLEQVIANLRELSDHQLSPQGLSQGLPQALEAMVEIQRQLGLPVSLQVADGYLAGNLPTQLVSRELFYIAQEAVVNALKHASASKIEISLFRLEEKIHLVVRNDGRGFEVASMLAGRETRGMGIMQARANRINGQLTITSDPDTGTEVVLRLDPIHL